MPWGDDFVEGYPPYLSGSSEFWQGLSDAAPFPDLSLGDDFESIESPIPLGCNLGVENRMESVTQAPTPAFDGSEIERQQLENIPDHLLAQHYTRNLTGRYSSKDRGWNYYTYFYNRFTNTHPFVLSALYSWTAAHLFFSGALKTLDNAIKYYYRCLSQMSISHNILVATSVEESLEIDGSQGVIQLSADDLDAVVVSLYFLASTDLLAARPQELRSLLRAMTTLVSLPNRHPRDGLAFEVCNWFCFLDARSSAFGKGSSSMIGALGGEEGLVNATKNSRGFLRNEYKMLYPADMIQRDAAHIPLNEIVLRLIAIFGEISRNFDRREEEIRIGVRLSLDNVREVRGLTATST
jgi:hypothetical protein